MKIKQFWYFRTVTDEIDDDFAHDSVMIPVDNVTIMLPTSTEELTIYFKQATSIAPVDEVVAGRNGRVKLNVTAGKMEQVMRTLIADINASPRNKPSGVTTIADDSTIDFDDSTRNPIYIDSGITSCGSIEGS
jgi:hypothetical protein